MENQSEVARLRQRIADECQASWWALYGLSSGSAQHEFIAAKLKRMDEHHQCLTALIGEEKATDALCEVWDEQAVKAQKQKEQVLGEDSKQKEQGK